MHRAARQSAIMKALASEGSCTVAELTRTLRVSDETIRRDIKAMAERGLVERVHGGVLLPELMREPDFRERMRQQAEEKRAIARLVAARITDGDSLMIDSGSTNLYVARVLETRRDLLAVTNNAEIARMLGAGRGNRVYLAGGRLRPDDCAVFGMDAVSFVQQFRARTAILSIGAVHAADGLMDFGMEEAEFAQAVMERSDTVIVAADHTKFGRRAPIRVCGFDEVDALVTDRPPPGVFARRLAEVEGCALVVPEGEAAELG